MAKRPDNDRRVRGGPTLGHTHIGVGVSFGFPLIVVGAGLLLGAYRTGGTLFWAGGAVLMLVGAILFASGRTV